MTTLVQTQGLRRVFGRPPNERVALDGIDLAVERGELLAVIGPSGSGKSTLLGIAGALDTAYQGEVCVLGVRPDRAGDLELARLRADRIGFVFQAFHLLDRLSVLDNVLVPSLFSPRPGAIGRAREALDRVGLADRERDAAAALSGGQRQRVAIARAIAHRPELLLCDEPTGNLDDETSAQVIAIFAALHRDGTTLVCATHEHALAAAATRRLHLRDGRLEPGEPAA
jgi:putative ABC transport system ATP-binding protein